jgi:hypothetical protein
LLRSGSSWRGTSGSNSSTPSDYQRRSDWESGQRGERDGDWGLTDGINRTAETARDYASNLSRSVSATASEYAATAGDYAEKAKRTIAEGSGRIAEQAQSTMQNTVDRVLREQPLAVALAGLAAGALVAAAFPATSIERQTLGPAGERLSEAATKAGQQLQEAASAAGERLMEVAEERGLTSSGLKEMAGDVAGSFGSAFSGEKQDKGSSRSGSGRSSSSSGSQSNASGSTSRGAPAGQYGSSSSVSSSGSGSSQSSSSGSVPRGTTAQQYGSSGSGSNRGPSGTS